jgi:hypothetical protein
MQRGAIEGVRMRGSSMLHRKYRNIIATVATTGAAALTKTHVLYVGYG